VCYVLSCCTGGQKDPVFVPALLIRDQVAFLTVMGHMMPKLQKETAFWKLPRPCKLGNPELS